MNIIKDLSGAKNYDKYMKSIRLVSSEKPIKISELQSIAQEGFGDMVKGVVDIEQKILAIGGDLHADEEALLLENGSSQSDLWGINLYPGNEEKEFIEFDSMINVRPKQNNRSRDVEDEKIRERIVEIVNLLINEK